MSVPNSVEYMTLKFRTIEARDAWLDGVFPERKATETPGYYECRDGITVFVFCEKVEVVA